MNDLLSTAGLAEIRARHAAAASTPGDIPALLTEVERLRADVAHLRRSWAGISGCLIKQGRHQDLTDDDLKDIPGPHAAYLRGHDATRHEAARQYERAEKLDRTRPTTWAYEQACKALENHRTRADAAEAKLGRLAQVRVWKNEDRKGFLFADDVREAVIDPASKQDAEAPDQCNCDPEREHADYSRPAEYHHGACCPIAEAQQAQAR